MDACLFQTFAVIDLFRLLDSRSERNRLPVCGDLFEPSRPAVGEHEISLGDPQFLLFSLRFHCYKVFLPI